MCTAGRDALGRFQLRYVARGKRTNYDVYHVPAGPGSGPSRLHLPGRSTGPWRRRRVHRHRVACGSHMAPIGCSRAQFGTVRALNRGIHYSPKPLLSDTSCSTLRTARAGPKNRHACIGVSGSVLSGEKELKEILPAQLLGLAGGHVLTESLVRQAQAADRCGRAYSPGLGRRECAADVGTGFAVLGRYWSWSRFLLRLRAGAPAVGSGSALAGVTDFRITLAVRKPRSSSAWRSSPVCSTRRSDWPASPRIVARTDEPKTATRMRVGSDAGPSSSMVTWRGP